MIPRRILVPSFAAIALTASIASSQPLPGQAPSAAASAEPAPAASAAPATPPAASAAPATPPAAPSAPATPLPGYYPPPGPAPAYPGYGYAPGAYYGSVPPAPPPPEPPPPIRRVSLTFSPLHLILPVFEAMGEVRLVDHFSAAVIGGAGSVPVDTTTGTVKVSVYEVGGQLAAYPMGDFDGLHLGAEVLYMKANADNLSGDIKQAAARGLAVGPLVGYKLVTRAGFTFLAQGGFEYIAARAEGSDDQGANTTHASDEDIVFLLNLNIGWSF